VTDTSGNHYLLAIGPTQQSANGGFTQSMYYAANIKASSSNTITVVFSKKAAYPDVRILEYSGIDPANPVDVTVGTTQPYSTVSSTGTVATTHAPDLLVAANSVQELTVGADATFTQRALSSPDGQIAEDRVVTAPGLYSASAAVNNPGTWVMQMVAFRSVGAQSPDSTAPTVSISTPVVGATLTGTTTVTVNASDTGTGVAGVQLQVDGIILGTADTTSPYTFSFSTAKFANGPHILTASAWDFANNTGTASPVSVTFSNATPGNPALSGVWAGQVPLPIVSVHSALMHDGKILMWDGQPSFGNTAIVWDPINNTTNWVPAPADEFCAGVEQMGDGRIMLMGGTNQVSDVGLTSASLFDPSTETWTVLPDMTYPRWYPTGTILPDGRVIVSSGETNCVDCDEPIHEIYNPATNSWSQLTSAPWTFPYYPHLYILPDGRVLAAATSEAPIASQVLNLTTLTWTAVGGASVDGGSSSMYLPGKILKMGKSMNPDDATQPSVATAYVLDMTQPTPAWRQVASMTFARTYHTSTILPDGTVLVTSGGTTTNPTDTTKAVLPAELWSPVTETWTTLASQTSPRLYHSEAVLLPDGRVLSYGGGRFNDTTLSTDQFSAEFYAPPYLFKGARPSIVTAPSQLSYGQNFTVTTPDAGQIASVSLIRFGGVTHAMNMSQRFLPLSFTATGGSLNVTAPANSNLAPAGYYMLFILNGSGVPSVAAIVKF
jgi:Domain of unknown function (DUF1929)/Bacterial Ig domain